MRRVMTCSMRTGGCMPTRRSEPGTGGPELETTVVGVMGQRSRGPAPTDMIGAWLSFKGQGERESLRLTHPARGSGADGIGIGDDRTRVKRNSEPPTRGLGTGWPSL